MEELIILVGVTPWGDGVTALVFAPLSPCSLCSGKLVSYVDLFKAVSAFVLAVAIGRGVSQHGVLGGRRDDINPILSARKMQLQLSSCFLGCLSKVREM